MEIYILNQGQEDANRVGIANERLGIFYEKRGVCQRGAADQHQGPWARAPNTGSIPVYRPSERKTHSSF